MKNLFFGLSLIAAVFVTGCNKAKKTTETTTPETTSTTDMPAHGEAGHDHETGHQETAIYSCPMHPEVTSDKPGTCPKCGMNLEKVKADENQEVPAE